MGKKLINHNIFYGLDIGSSVTKLTIAELVPNNELLVHATGISETKGVLKGCIINKTELKNCIQNAIGHAQSKTNITGQSIISNLPLYNSSFKTLKSRQKVKDPHTGVSQSDIQNILKSINIPLNNHHQKRLHSNIHHFSVDHRCTNSPLKKKGQYLDAYNLSILGDIRNIRQLKQTLLELKLIPKAIIHDSYCLSHSLLSEKERKEGGIILDIGTTTSNCHVMVNNQIINTQYIPLGQKHIIRDIATCLNTSQPEAKRLFKKFGNTYLPFCDSKNNIQIHSLNNSHTIKHRLLCQVIESRLNEIIKILFKKCKNSIHSCSTIHITGCGQSIDGIKEYIETKWKKKTIFDPNISKESMGDINYSISLGGILAGLHQQYLYYQKEQSKKIIKNNFFNFLK